VTNWEISAAGFTVSQAHDGRDVSAAFAELALPVLPARASGSNESPLELSLAGRYDDYDDVGSTFNPRFGMTWTPFAWVKVRGTWGTSFRAPPFYVSDPDIRTPLAVVVPLADPTNPPSNRTQALLLTGVVPNLHEETAEVWTAGLDLTPLDDLRISFTYFDI